MVVPAVLLGLAAVVGLFPGAVPGVERAAARFADHPAYAQWVLQGRQVHYSPVPSRSQVEGFDYLYA